MRRSSFIVAVVVAFGLACGSGGGGKSSDYDLGCDDGRSFGFANGLSDGENCVGYNDDSPGTAFDTGDIDYNEGYDDCYPDGYADGYDEGSTTAGCR